MSLDQIKNNNNGCKNYTDQKMARFKKVFLLKKNFDSYR